MSVISTWILAMKTFLISAGALFVAMGIKASFPAAVNEAPAVWSVIDAWLKPPYLYVVVNGIIITILASSRFQQIRDAEPPVRSDRRLISVRTPPPEEFATLSAEPDIRRVVDERSKAVVVYEHGDRILELKPVLVNGSIVDNETGDESRFYFGEDDEVDDLFMESTSAVSPERISPEFWLDYLPKTDEKPPVPSRYNRRKPRSRTAPEASQMLAKHETLENVWKRITEARHDSVASDKDSPPASSVLQKEPSPSQDELNRRFEDFIEKVNCEMRLQRQRSLDRHLKKKNSGVHT